MRTVGLFAAKQKLSELVRAAAEGEEIGITNHGRLAARLVPPQREAGWEEILAGMEQVRRQVNRRRRAKVSIRALIAAGRK